MKPVVFPQVNRSLNRPSDLTAAECDSLGVHDTGRSFISCWQPSDEERRAIAEGAPIWLWVLGTMHPPVAVEVADPFREVR